MDIADNVSSCFRAQIGPLVPHRGLNHHERTSSATTVDHPFYRSRKMHTPVVLGRLFASAAQPDEVVTKNFMPCRFFAEEGCPNKPNYDRTIPTVVINDRVTSARRRGV
jgi:hypothetical protein